MESKYGESINALVRHAKDLLGINLSDAQLAQFQRLTDLLLAWNTRMNLTGITDSAEIAIKHYLDSLTLLRHLPQSGRARLMDVGTGAGFPGLPLAIALPQMRISLLDATAKKLRFIDAAGQALGLENIRTFHARAEIAGRDDAHRGKYDFVVARAVGRLPALMECTLPLAKRGGTVIAMQGASAHEDAHDAVNAIATLGGELQTIDEVRLPTMDKPRHLVIARKVAKTPRRYPRQAGIPARNPIL